jgi:hypothetical protein
MKMTVKEAHRILSNGLVNASSEHEWCVAFKKAIDTMHKYQKIHEIVKQKDYDRFNTHNYYGYFLRVQDIRKVLEDENND